MKSIAGVTDLLRRYRQVGQALETFEWAGGQQDLQRAPIGQLQVFGNLRQGIEHEGAGVHMVVRNL
ncbi:hypothetical protein D3C84_1249450 [compost metagenome]